MRRALRQTRRFERDKLKHLHKHQQDWCWQSSKTKWAYQNLFRVCRCGKWDT